MVESVRESAARVAERRKGLLEMLKPIDGPVEVAHGPWPFNPNQTRSRGDRDRLIRVLMLSNDLVEWKRRYGLGMEGGAYHLLAEAVEAAMGSPAGDEVRAIRRSGAEQMSQEQAKA